MPIMTAHPLPSPKPSQNLCKGRACNGCCEISTVMNPHCFVNVAIAHAQARGPVADTTHVYSQATDAGIDGNSSFT